MKKVLISKLGSEKKFNSLPIAEQVKNIEIIGPTLRVGTNYPDNLFLSQNPSGLPSSSLVGTSPSPFALRISMDIADRKGKFGFSFKGTGGKISLNFKKNSGPKFKMSEIVSSSADGAINSVIAELGSKGKYILEFECDSNVAFGGVFFLDKDSRITKSVNRQKPRVAFVGDSFSEPTISDLNSSFAWQGFPQVFGRITNTNVQSVAAGGTGYLREHFNRVAGFPRVQSDVISKKFDVVVVALGINDLAYFKAPEIGEVLVEILNEFKAKSSNTLVYVTSPFWPRGMAFAPESLSELNRILRLVCEGYEQCAFIDLWSPKSYIEGRGNMLAVAGDGNADWITGPDGTHPTILGHEYLAKIILQRMLERI